MNAQRLQGLVFSFSALGVAFAATTLGRFSPQSELIVLAALIVVLGIPHGAMDTIFAQKLYGIRTPWAWARFGLVYLCSHPSWWDYGLGSPPCSWRAF